MLVPSLVKSRRDVWNEGSLSAKTKTRGKGSESTKKLTTDQQVRDTHSIRLSSDPQLLALHFWEGLIEAVQETRDGRCNVVFVLSVWRPHSEASPNWLLNIKNIGFLSPRGRLGGIDRSRSAGLVGDRSILLQESCERRATRPV